MKSSELQGKWDQLKGVIREFWGELTGDDVDFIAGQRDRLIGKIEERYGLPRQEAEKKVDEVIDSL